MNHRKRMIAAVALPMALGLAATAHAQDAMNETSGPAAADPVEDASGMDVAFGLSAATDYMFRGVSQSDNDPAVFASASIEAGGFYAGIGTETVNFLGVDQEYDLWAGHVFKLGGASLDVGVVRYGYVDAPIDIDTVDAKVALSGKLAGFGLGVAGYWTPDYFGTDDDALYAEVNASRALTGKLTLSGAVGHQQISAALDYWTWNAGLRYAMLSGATVDVRYHDTDTNAFGKRGDARLVASFSVGF